MFSLREVRDLNRKIQNTVALENWRSFKKEEKGCHNPTQFKENETRQLILLFGDAMTTGR